MPSLVEKKEQGKKGAIYEVKWMWMPAFLAMDEVLVRRVDVELNKLFAGGDPPMPGVMEATVIKTILKSYPMMGLEEVLKAIVKANPEVAA